MRSRHDKRPALLSPYLTGSERVALGMMRASIQIILSAIEHGYLTRELEYTGKEMGSGYNGFQGGVVKSIRDIEGEVEFFRGGAAASVVRQVTSGSGVDVLSQFDARIRATI